MMELVDMKHLKCFAYKRAGSSPAAGTIILEARRMPSKSDTGYCLMETESF